MKKVIISSLIFLAIVSLLSCEDDSNEETVLYKEKMREFVKSISSHAKAIDSDFVIIPQNGQEICTSNGKTEGIPDMDYLRAIDAIGREDLFFGYDFDDVKTNEEERDYMMAFLDICEANEVEVLVTDYCWTHSKMDSSYLWNYDKGYASFAAPDRDLNVIPDYPEYIHKVSTNNVTSMWKVKNFLYLLNYENFTSKADLIDELRDTDYDLIIMDYFFEGVAFTANEISELKTKKNGSDRMVISYMSIGEAENYRYYWQESWLNNKPAWLKEENPNWEGNYKVEYWNPDWQAIIYGSENAYLNKIIAAGFDGVYLDIIDAFEYFEN